jgi:hypothetical protein
VSGHRNLLRLGEICVSYRAGSVAFLVTAAQQLCEFADIFIVGRRSASGRVPSGRKKQTRETVSRSPLVTDFVEKVAEQGACVARRNSVPANGCRRA